MRRGFPAWLEHPHVSGLEITPEYLWADHARYLSDKVVLEAHDVDTYPQPLLHYACVRGDHEIYRLLKLSGDRLGS